MASESRVIRMENFNQNQGINRSLYFVLVQSLWRNPVESMLVIALWVWLLRAGFSNVILRILFLPHALINELANEALMCIDCINGGARFIIDDELIQIPLTQSLLANEISLHFFLEHRAQAMHGMGRAINEVCLRDLTDIIDRALNRNNASTSMPSQMNSPTVNNSVDSSFGQVGYAQSSHARTPSYETPRENRTMFVTFSRGYPVAEFEVRYFFNRIFGDCIEAFYMQEVGPNQQALHARIVFYEPSLMDFILNGMEKVKFSINGKHVWLRKFVPRRPRSTPPPRSAV